VFAERRQRLRESMGPDAVAVLLGAKLATRSNDTEFPFRQDSDFWYLTGFEHPNALAVLRTDGGPEFSLYVEPRDRELETWTGYRPGVEGARAEYHADEAFTNEEFLPALGGMFDKAKRIYHQLGRDNSVDARITETLGAMRMRSRRGLIPADAIHDPRTLLHEMRLVKEPAELERMRQAAAITHHAHVAAAAIAQPGRFEYELQAAIEFEFRSRGAAGPAYSSIVGGGRNATVLHYISNNQPLNDGELLLIDAGCEWEGYAADVTRTFPVGGRFTPERLAIYEIVLAAQHAALDHCKPGSTLPDIHDIAVRVITEGLVELKLLDGPVDDAIANETFRRYYMHSTSHWLGLDVHDVGNYKQDGENRVLEAGICLTIEPGIYIPDDDEKADAAFRGIGVRIEDDVAITTEGHENLTAAIPKAPSEIEALVRGD
jgi:Xaa-Pro aminopeptidase